MFAWDTERSGSTLPVYSLSCPVGTLPPEAPGVVTGFTRTRTEIVESFIDGRRLVDVTVTYTWLNLEPLEGSTIDYNIWFGNVPLAADDDPVLSLLDSYQVCKIFLFCMRTLHTLPACFYAFHTWNLFCRNVQQKDYPMNSFQQVSLSLRFTYR